MVAGDHFIRGVQLCSVLANLGRSLRMPRLFHENFSLSCLCPHIEYFISHSWARGWCGKYVSLKSYFFHSEATLVSLVGCACVLLAVLLGGVTGVGSGCHPNQENLVVVFTLSGFFLYLAWLLGGDALARSLGVPRRDCACFLDRCCINQVDPIEKRRGIESLSEFLAKSRALLVVWSDDFFRRLWCVYEMAIYQSLHGTRTLVVVPMHLVMFVYTVLLFDLFVQIFSVTPVELFGIPVAKKVMLDLIALLFGTIVMRFAVVWDREQVLLRETVTSFRLSCTECSDPSDRVMILRDIARRYCQSDEDRETSQALDGSVASLAPPWSTLVHLSSSYSVLYNSRATSAEGSVEKVSGKELESAKSYIAALVGFENYVRSSLVEPITVSVGYTAETLPLRYAMIMSLPAVWTTFGLLAQWLVKSRVAAVLALNEPSHECAPGDREPMDPKAIAFLLPARVMRAVTFYPIIICIALFLCKRLRDKGGGTCNSVIRWVFIVVSTLVVSAVFYMFGFSKVFDTHLEAHVVFLLAVTQTLIFALFYRKTLLPVWSVVWRTLTRTTITSPM